MGTRSGDVDPALPYFLARKLDMEPQEVYDLLNKKSGLYGLSGVSNDMREILAEAEDGNQQAEQALEVFCYRLKKYIGAYRAVLGRLHGLIFTAGIGENCPEVRRQACQGLERAGICLDEDRNAGTKGEEAVISADDADVAVMVVPTNEELKIAIDTYAICSKGEEE
jgi:acetate kinase